MGWVKLSIAKILIIVSSAIYGVVTIIIFALLIALGNGKTVSTWPELKNAWIGFAVFDFIIMICITTIGIIVGVLKV